MNTKKRLEILGCPACGAGKSRTTHSFGTYRVYNTNTTLTLRCKTCGHKQKFKYIKGGFPNEDAESLREVTMSRVTNTKKHTATRTKKQPNDL